MRGFDDALKFVLRWEGGKVDDPVDRGGRTAFGITQHTYNEWRGADDRDVWNIDQDEIRAIYSDRYWGPLHCDDFEYPLALVLFDTAVLHGAARAAKWMTASSWADVSAACRAYALLTLRRESYQRLIEADSTQERFRKGWMNRLDSLRKEATL